MRPTSILVSSVALVFAGCAPTAIETTATPSAQVGPNVGAPSTPADFQDAKITEVERYRPMRVMPSCSSDSLPTHAPPSALTEALSASQAYSDEEQGVGLIVMKDGAVIHQSYAEGTDETTKTVSASMMKSVLALTVGIAIDRGYIGSVDDPASRYIPEWSGDERAKITIRDLLTMSSGLEPQPFGPFLLAPDANAISIATGYAKEAGTEFRYNNGVSQVIGAIVDRQVKQHGYAGFAEFLYQDFWCPLGGGEAFLWTDTTGMPRTYAGLHAGLDSWAKVGELVRNGGRANGRQIVPEAWLEEMGQPSPANPQYGYQIWLAGGWEPMRFYAPEGGIGVPHKEPFVASDLVFFDGFGGQRVYVIPSLGLTIVRSGEVNLQFDDSVIPNLLTRASE